MADISLRDLLNIVPNNQPQSLADLGRYGPRVLPSNYQTQLPVMDEMQFRNWITQNRVPFDPNAKGPTDYDMRGFYQAAQQQQPGVETQVNPIDRRMHYSDRFKTPYHQSFSSISQWAGPNAPRWSADETYQQDPSGRIVFVERAK